MSDLEYQELIEKIETDNNYRKKESDVRTTMSVPEMRKLLGIKKTESYWIIHKNYFKTEIIGGRMRIDIASFEKWYANQVKHKKITGEEPGKELRSKSYSAREMAEVLGVTESIVYEIWQRENLEIFYVDFVKRITIEEFERWYASQNRYRKREKITDATLLEEKYFSVQEVAELLGISTNHFSLILYRGNYREYFELVTYQNKVWISKESFHKFLSVQSRYKLVDEAKLSEMVDEEISKFSEYISRNEAAQIAGVAPTTITKWLQKGNFSGKAIGYSLWINRAEFMSWYEKERKEKSDGSN